MAGPDSDKLEDLPRRERRRLEVRGRILDAAEELFYRQGFQATTVVELAEHADVAKKTLFNHFPTKQQVLRELAMQVFENLLLDVESVRKSEASTRERIAAFFARLDRISDQTGPMAREMAFEFLHATQESGLQLDEGERFRTALEGILRDGVAQGDVTRRHDPKTLAESISAVYLSLIMSWSQDGDFPVARKAREAAAFLADAVERRPDED
ncbi:MAG: helix-turn-helix transcriptional regulator [Deltaproteobacteria bacterium]|nr:helix-turn-helix transcriptional regulator [Deltaproteobacteria bacterium]